MKEPKIRYGTKEAIDAIACQLHLPNESWMQDWAYIVADADQLSMYIDLYDRTSNDNERFVLMQMIIQATDNKKQESQLSDSDWQRVRRRLECNFELHEYTVFYWSCLEEDELEFCFHITPEIRDIWLRYQS
ncbi:MAG: hypothetical protein AAGE93_18320 [Bacteroidota bacterium]